MKRSVQVLFGVVAMVVALGACATEPGSSVETESDAIAPPSTSQAPTYTPLPSTPKPAPTKATTPKKPAPKKPATTSSCDSNYEGACLKANVEDYDCQGGSGNGPYYIAGPFKSVGYDPYDLDRDSDGIACE